MHPIFTHQVKSSTGKISQNRKERHFYKQYTVVTKDLTEPLILRLYATKAVCYACFWLHDKKHGIYISGGGNATGYGYHKASAAFSNALRDAGIKLNTDIDGRGDSAINNALASIVKTLGYKKVLVVEASA